MHIDTINTIGFSILDHFDNDRPVAQCMRNGTGYREVFRRTDRGNTGAGLGLQNGSRQQTANKGKGKQIRVKHDAKDNAGNGDFLYREKGI